MTKKLLFGVYTLILILFVGAIYTAISLKSKKENSSIVRASESANLFQNINPNFKIDFVDGKYIRFETVSSFLTLEKDEVQTFWEKMRYKFGINQERKGLEISLIEVSYDSEMLGLIQMDLKSSGDIKSGFELTKTGREIGGDTKKVVSKDTVIAKDVYQGVDIEYQIIEGKGIKEEIVLKELAQYSSACEQGNCVLPVNRFLFKIKLDEGLLIKRSIDGSGQYPNGFTYISDGKGNYFAHFLPEFAVDAVGVKTSNVASNILQTDSGEALYEVILDPEWLLSSDRVFPIRIDPSIVHDTEVLFDEGIYSGVYLDELQAIRLKSNMNSGAYTSSILKLEDNVVINSIKWQGYGDATSSIEEPFSRLDLVFEENFNNEISLKSKAGGSLFIPPKESERLEVNSEINDNITVEFWLNRRYISDSIDILASNLGKLIEVGGEYVFEDSEGTQHSTSIPVKYNEWQYIAVVFNISSSSISIYIDEQEYKGDVIFDGANTLEYITFGGSGYIDVVRVYERLLTRNELMSNASFGKIVMQYQGANSSVMTDDWINKKEYIPERVDGEGFIHLKSDREAFTDYEILSFNYLSDLSSDAILGSTLFENGSTAIGDTLEAKYLDMNFTPELAEESCLLSLEGFEIHTLGSKEIEVVVNGVSNKLEDMYLPNKTNYLSIAVKEDSIDIYLNGNKGSVIGTFPSVVGNIEVGKGCSVISTPINGDISTPRVYESEKEEPQILNYHTVASRRYDLPVTFKADLQSNAQIQSLDTLTFSINEIPYGADNYIVNLDIGDTVVISQGQYQAEGTVLEIEKDIGLVTLNAWEEDSKVPPSGFDSSAQVRKWESVNILIKDFLNSSTVSQEVYFNTKEGVVIKDVKFHTGFESGENLSLSLLSMRYRLLFLSSKLNFSPSVSNVRIDYVTEGPKMEQIMRHGKWFNEEGQQPFWWSN